MRAAFRRHVVKILSRISVGARSDASVGFIIHKILYFCKDLRQNPVGGRSTVEKHTVRTEMRIHLETLAVGGTRLT